MSAEILEAQVTFLKVMRTRAELAVHLQHTISKRQLLQFADDVREFCEQFILLNETTIKSMEDLLWQDEEKPATTLSPSIS